MNATPNCATPSVEQWRPNGNLRLTNFNRPHLCGNAMPDFRTFHLAKRVPAVAMRPIIDPAWWMPDSLGPVSDWAYRISDRDQDEIIAAVEEFRRRRFSLGDVTKESFPLPNLSAVLADIRRELIDGRGMVMVQDFPIDKLDREGVAIGYLGLGSYLGDKMIQNKHGHVLGHV